MAAYITCPSCHTKLSLPRDVGHDSRIKCPRCGTVIPPKKILSSPESQPASVAEERPALPRSLPATPIVAYAMPTGAILVAILSLALSILIGQYLVGLIVACVAALGSVIGLVLLLLNKWKGTASHLCGVAICATVILVSINALMLQGSLEKNEELVAKNERDLAQAKADLDESRMKAADAEDASRKAEEILKKAQEAPKKAEAFFKMAKDVQEKSDAAEKRTAELLAKVEELEKKNDLDRKTISADRAKVEMSEKNLKALQKNLDQTQKDIEDKRQELVMLKKQIEADKKTAADELATLKKQIDVGRKAAEDKEKDATGLLKKVEEALKGAALNLKDKNPEVRLKAAKNLARLDKVPGIKVTGEALVEAMLDPVPAVRNAANEALEKVDPVVHPHVLTLIIGQNKQGAWKGLEKLGKEATSALPALVAFYRNPPNGVNDQVPYIAKQYWLDSLTRIAPNDKRVVQIVLEEVATTPKQTGVHFTRQKAISLLDKIGGENKDKVKALLTVLDYRGLAVEAIGAIERIGLPEAAEAIPFLKKLKLSPDDAVRQAATKALTKIETSK